MLFLIGDPKQAIYSFRGAGRCVPELKKCPDQGHEKQDILGNRPGGVPGPGLGLGNHVLQRRVIYFVGFFLLFGHWKSTLPQKDHRLGLT